VVPFVAQLLAETPKWVNILNSTCLFVVISLQALEFLQIKAFGFKNYTNDVSNLLDVFHNLAYLPCFVTRMLNKGNIIPSEINVVSETMIVSNVLMLLLVFAKMMKYMQGFGFFSTMIFLMTCVFSALSPFIAFLFLMVLLFGLLFFVMGVNTQNGEDYPGLQSFVANLV
jgi:hypothetical protein